METVREYLEMRLELIGDREPPKGWLYLGIDDFVLKHGREYEFAPLPADVPRGEMKMCFYNSFMLSMERSDLTYVEGYAVNIIAAPHAWCVDADGRVVDPTWEEGRSYFGVPFKTAYVLSVALRTEVSGVFWEHECKPNVPLLTGEDDLEEVLA